MRGYILYVRESGFVSWQASKFYPRSLCVSAAEAQSAGTMQRDCLSRSSSDEVSLNHKMTLVTDGGEQDRDAVASFDLTFEDAHQIF